MSKKPLTSSDIADMCHVTHRAVLKWIEKGKIKAFRTPGNHTRVNEEDFLAFLKEHDMPIPDKFKNFGGKKRIMIIDDDVSMVTTLKKILSDEEKYDLDVAFDGFSAGLSFSSFKPDLITLDLMMPMVDGFELCQKIRSDKNFDEVKIVVITSLEDDKTKKRIMEAGADEFITKPISAKDLLSKVETQLSA